MFKFFNMKKSIKRIENKFNNILSIHELNKYINAA